MKIQAEFSFYSDSDLQSAIEKIESVWADHRKHTKCKHTEMSACDDFNNIWWLKATFENVLAQRKAAGEQTYHFIEVKS